MVRFLISKTILIISIMTSSFMYSQNQKFELTPESFTNYIVIPFEGKIQSDLYKKSLEWIEFTYKNPREVLKGNIENEYIRFEGVKSYLYCISAMGKRCFDVRYTIEISFKDGKTKFEILNSEVFSTGSGATAAGNSRIPFDNPSLFFKKGELRNAYKYIMDVPEYYNSLSENFKEFVKSESIPSKKNDW